MLIGVASQNCVFIGHHSCYADLRLADYTTYTNDVLFSLEDRSEVSRNDEIVSVVVKDGDL